MKYLELQTIDKDHVFIEVAANSGVSGIKKAGLNDIANDAIAGVQLIFEETLRRAVMANANAILGAVENLESPPSEITATFGLTLSGEAGVFVVSKATAEANYEIKLTWKTG